MPSAKRLLGLFPPAWRERYGDEFLAMLGSAPLRVRQVFDIVMAAIDAWLSADVRRAVRASRVASTEGGTMTLQSLMACGRAQSGATPRDGLIGAAVMLGVTALMTTLGVFARRSGWPIAGEALVSSSFAAALLVSMPFWLMKGRPWKAQAVVIVVCVGLVVGASLLASAI